MMLDLKTSRGAVVSVHFGKLVTTNLWNGSWYEIQDLKAIEALRQLAKKEDACDADWITLRDRFDINEIGVPYRREIKAGAPGAIPVDDEKIEEIVVDKPPVKPAIDLNVIRKKACEKLLKFFSEFSFTPAARFVNTLAYASKSGSEATSYVKSYMELVNSPDANAISEKIKSAEFLDILANMAECNPEKRINQRLEIYYGPAGTGKTTKAIKNYPDAEVVTCNSSTLPDELMRTFDFTDETGKPVFKKSALRIAMETGKPIIFDEVNLLSFDCLRMLQTVLDDKSVFNYNGETIAIAEGFKVIGTMNLVVNEQVYSLPEPLVDRAGHIESFDLTANQLAAYSF